MSASKTVYIVQAHHEEFNMTVTRAFLATPSQEMLDHLHPGPAFRDWDIIGEIAVETVEEVADG